MNHTIGAVRRPLLDDGVRVRVGSWNRRLEDQEFNWQEITR